MPHDGKSSDHSLQKTWCWPPKEEPPAIRPSRQAPHSSSRFRSRFSLRFNGWRSARTACITQTQFGNPICVRLNLAARERERVTDFGRSHCQRAVLTVCARCTTTKLSVCLETKRKRYLFGFCCQQCGTPIAALLQEKKGTHQFFLNFN